MSFCSSPDRKTIFLPGSGFGPLVGPSHVVCGPAYLATAALASDTASAKAEAGNKQPVNAMVEPASTAKRQSFADIAVPPFFIFASSRRAAFIDGSVARRSSRERRASAAG